MCVYLNDGHAMPTSPKLLPLMSDVLVEAEVACMMASVLTGNYNNR